MMMPSSFAAATTSSSFTEPPGWIIALAPVFAAATRPSGAGNIASVHAAARAVGAQPPFADHLADWAGPWRFAEPRETEDLLAAAGAQEADGGADGVALEVPADVLPRILEAEPCTVVGQHRVDVGDGDGALLGPGLAGPDARLGHGGGIGKVVGDCFVQRHVGAMLLGRGRAEGVQRADRWRSGVDSAAGETGSDRHWQASHASGFSREHASASSSV